MKMSVTSWLNVTSTSYLHKAKQELEHNLQNKLCCVRLKSFWREWSYKTIVQAWVPAKTSWIQVPWVVSSSPSSSAHCCFKASPGIDNNLKRLHSTLEVYANLIPFSWVWTGISTLSSQLDKASNLKKNPHLIVKRRQLRSKGWREYESPYDSSGTWLNLPDV